MRQIYLQKQFYQLAKKNILKPGEEAKHREKHIMAWEALRKAGLTAQEASKEIGISQATLYRWQKRMRTEGWQGLEKRSRKPKRVRKKQWSTDLIEGVRSLRCLYPAWGKEKIKVLLEEDGLVCSVSTVGRVERAHRTHLEEFYAFHELEGDLVQLNKDLRGWEWVYNNIRPHRALDNLTPRKYI
jgi:transposase